MCCTTNHNYNKNVRLISSLISFINICLFLGEEVDLPEASEKANKTQKDSSTLLVKAHKSQSCYHIEYKLPGDTEAVKVDIVVFGPVVKMYTEEEFKVSMTRCMSLCPQ